MKIVIVVPTHWEYFMGGAQFQARLLVETLDKLDCAEIVYIATRTRPTTTRSDHRIVALPHSPFLHRYGYFWDAIPLWRALRRERPDVIYQTVGCAHTGICAAFARQHGIRMVWHIASDIDCERFPFSLASLLQPHKLLEKSLIEWSLTRVPVIVAQTHVQSEKLRQNYGRRPDYLIRNFIPKPPQPSKSMAQIEVLWVANLKDIKQPQVFLDLAQSLSDVANLSFSMVGAPYEELDKQRAIDERVDALPNVRYFGRLTQEEVANRMAAAHMLVNTSEYEGFSNAFIQAWMHCMPVLTIGVNPDGLLDGGALGSACGSATELSTSIRRIAADPMRLATNGLEAREYAIRVFSMENAERLAKLLLGFAQRSSGSSLTMTAVNDWSD